MPTQLVDAIIDVECHTKPSFGKGVDMATLVRWTPFREIEAVERRMRRMVDDLAPRGLVGMSIPAADIYEDDDAYVVEVDVPGFEESDLDIEVTNHTLCVKGERKEEEEETGKTFQLKERLERSFERRFALPEEADLDALEAKYRKGVLEIRMPKSVAPESRRVEIESK
jgi:HSP20 family protein